MAYQQPVPMVTAPAPFLRATGRAKQAGFFVALGGAAVVLSAFIPWATAPANVILLHPTPTGGAQTIIALFGVAYVAVGTRILMGAARRLSQVALWLLSVLGGLSVAGIFSVLNDSNNNLGTGVVQPGVGLFAALGGVVAAVLGTLLFQTVRLPRKAVLSVTGVPVSTSAPPPTGAPAPLLSPDKLHWWDGASWRSVAEALPPSAPRSADGMYWWDGSFWRSIPSAAAVSAPVGI